MRAPSPTAASSGPQQYILLLALTVLLIFTKYKNTISKKSAIFISQVSKYVTVVKIKFVIVVLCLFECD